MVIITPNSMNTFMTLGPAFKSLTSNYGAISKALQEHRTLIYVGLGAFSVMYTPFWSILTNQLLGLIGYEYIEISSTTMADKLIPFIKYYSARNERTPIGYVIASGGKFFGNFNYSLDDNSRSNYVDCKLMIAKSFLKSEQLIEDHKYIKPSVKLPSPVINNDILNILEGNDNDYPMEQYDGKKYKMINYGKNSYNYPYVQSVEINQRPSKKQSEIIATIKTHFMVNASTVALIHGPIGCGKSMIGQLLARELNADFTDTFNPFESDTSHINLSINNNKMPFSKENPFIIIFEEIDIALALIHERELEKGSFKQDHRDVHIKNKIDWNKFMDRFDRKLFPNVILLMTTNKAPQYFDDLDPAYMRTGRVNLKLECSTPFVASIDNNTELEQIEGDKA